MKRTASTALLSESKRVRLQSAAVMATHIYNYMLSDPLVDWLKIQNRRGTRANPEFSRTNGFSDFLMQKGIEFETKLIDYLDRNKLKVQKVAESFSEEGCKETRRLMSRGVPILHSAPVMHSKYQTGGIIDLLVRSDHLKKIVDESPLTHEESIIKSPGLGGKPWHYVVVDIKFSTLPLRADGVLLLNSGHYPAYKAQVWIYNQAVGEIQGYTPRYGYILGRRWRYTKKNVTHSGLDCLDKLGVIDYKGADKNYISKTEDAVAWVRDVREHASEWSVNPPSRPELYPNMCIDSGVWNKEKAKIADMIGEITSVWYCGIKHRSNAIEDSVMSWRDKKCTSKTIGMSGSRAPTVDAILNINRQSKDKVRPDSIGTDLYEWRDTSEREVFVDFETLSDIFADFEDLPHQRSMDMIFMIGVGWEEDGKWVYRSFTCTSSSRNEEYRIMDEFNSLMKEMDYPKMWCWHAEPNFWEKAENRQFELVSDENKVNICDKWEVNDWADLAKLFREEPIVVKGCFKFGLKEIAGALRKHKCISAKMESECSSGMTAMVNAWKCYSTCDDPLASPIMKDITAYNEWDCKVLWDILSYLRGNH